MNKQNIARRFNCYMPLVNEIWVAEVLGMERNAGKGPDIVGGDRIIEVKFALFPNSNNYVSWKVLDHQTKYGENGKKRFWLMGTYSLNQELDLEKEVSILEERVIEREAFLVPWEWMNKFSPHFTKGKSEKYEWEHTFRYPKLKMVPKIIESFPVKKGTLHLTEGINREDWIDQIKITS